MTKKRKIPAEPHLLAPRWSFKNKRDGSFRAHILAMACNQILGVYFTKH